MRSGDLLDYEDVRDALVVWRGTAELIGTDDCRRVPAALVRKSERETAVIQIDGQWVIAGHYATREWETMAGQLVIDVQPEIAARIEAA